MTAPADPLSLLGKTLAGHFLVQALVGEGRHSIVYRGEHIGPKKPVALKCLKLGFALEGPQAEMFTKRFREESKAFSALSKSHAPFVRSIGSGMTTSESGAHVPYSVFEWLDGRSLARDLAERRKEGGSGRPLAAAVALLEPAVLALAAAHDEGMAHGDVSPGNLFLVLRDVQSAPEVKVLDLGIAKVVSDLALEMGLEATPAGAGVRMFTPTYGAPEHFDRTIGDFGPWTDCYALALILIEWMRDRPAIEGDPAAAALDVLRRPTPRKLGVGVGDELEAVFAKALSVAPRTRWQNVRPMWDALKQALAKEETATPVGAKAVVAAAAPVAATRAGSPSSGATKVVPAAPASSSKLVAPAAQPSGSSLPVAPASSSKLAAPASVPVLPVAPVSSPKMAPAPPSGASLPTGAGSSPKVAVAQAPSSSPSLTAASSTRLQRPATPSPAMAMATPAMPFPALVTRGLPGPGQRQAKSPATPATGAANTSPTTATATAGAPPTSATSATPGAPAKAGSPARTLMQQPATPTAVTPAAAVPAAPPPSTPATTTSTPPPSSPAGAIRGPVSDATPLLLARPMGSGSLPPAMPPLPAPARLPEPPSYTGDRDSPTPTRAAPQQGPQHVPPRLRAPTPLPAPAALPTPAPTPAPARAEALIGMPDMARTVREMLPPPKANVRVGDLPSVIVDDPDKDKRKERQARARQTVRVPLRQDGTPETSVTPTGPGRRAYAERRTRSRRRLFIVGLVSFVVVFAVGAVVLGLHYLSARGQLRWPLR